MLSNRIFTIAVALAGMTSVASAVPVNETTGDLKFFEGGTNSEGLANFDAGLTISGSFTRTLSGLPSNIDGNADVTFSAAGDFSFGSENVSLSIEGTDLGTFLNDMPGDDDFDNSSFGDQGFSTAAVGTRTATADDVDIATALNDGALDLTYTFGSSVNDFQGTDFVRTDISYETASTSVPAPGTIGLLGAGLVGLGLIARRRHTL
jgi:hypothetical protein